MATKKSAEGDDPSDDFWQDQVWAANESSAAAGGGAGNGDGAGLARTSSSKSSKTCYKCGQSKTKGAKVTYADGSQHWFCKVRARYRLCLCRCAL